jgi:hypothetical protein
MASGPIVGRQDRLLFYAFDPLYLEGFDLRRSPQIGGKRILKSLYDETGLAAPVRAQRGCHGDRLPMAASRLQTGHRSTGKEEQEAAVKWALVELGFKEVAARTITTIALAPDPVSADRAAEQIAYGGRSGQTDRRLSGHLRAHQPDWRPAARSLRRSTSRPFWFTVTEQD